MRKFYRLAIMFFIVTTLISTTLSVAASEHKLAATGLSDDDNFGHAVAIAGDYAVVGVPGDDDNGSGAGAVFIFTRNQGGNNNWGEISKIEASDGAAGDGFGWAVAIAGDYIVIGAPGDDDNGSNSGSVFIFANNQDGSWSQVKKIVADDGNIDDGFGSAVAISNDRIIVGMPGDDTVSKDAGAAFIFARNQGGTNNWGQAAKISVSNTLHLGSPENFGLAVAIDGDNAVVGAPGTDDSGIDSGLAYLFNRNQGGSNNWGKIADLAASDGAAYYEFALAVGISGDFAIIGSGRDNNANGSQAGAVYFFNKNQGGSNNWGELTKKTTSDGNKYDYFGTAVAIAGNYAVAGAPGHDSQAYSAGAAYIMERNEGGNNNWGIKEKLTAGDGDTFEFFGDAATISSTRDTLIGAPEQDDMTGAAYLFDNAAKTPVASGVFFPHVASNSGWETEIAIINTADKAISAQLISYSDNGVQVGPPLSITLNPMSRRQIAVGSELSNPDKISFIVFTSESKDITGYTKFSHKDYGYRAAIPSVSKLNSGKLYIPHIASGNGWWTGISLVNTTTEAKTLTLKFDNNTTKTVSIDSGSHKAFSIAKLFDNVSQPEVGSAIISNADGIVGLELFGSQGALSGILLKDELATTIYYPHIATTDGWWTGIVAYDPDTANDHFTVTPYQEDGTTLTPINVPMVGKQKYDGDASKLDLPTTTAWFKIDAEYGITGFELFGNGSQLGGYTGVGISATKGVFPKIDQLGWTGINFVNPTTGNVNVTLSARRDDGSIVNSGSVTMNLAPGEKVVNTVEELFPDSNNINEATFITYSADKEIVGFQLNGSVDSLMLDALPAGI